MKNDPKYTKDPLVSVIMPVYNGEKYVEQSVKSILDQTYDHFELIIINDASTDGTVAILNELKDPRIKLIQNTTNLCNYPSRNIGIKIAQGKYLFVMDSDDIALPNRIERQLVFMINHPDVGICSSWFRLFEASTNDKIINYPSDPESLKVAFLENNYCLHPGLCIRKEFFKGMESLLYDEQFRYASDYDFVAKNFKNFKICNIPEVLMEYRVHENQITSSRYSEQQFYADQIRLNYLSNIELYPDEIEKRIHLSLVNRRFSPEFTMEDYIKWGNKILNYNMKYPFFKNELLIRFLRMKLKSQTFLMVAHSQEGMAILNN
jgi:glycosyltransferase involved in cell wall biosynthesis